MTDSPFSDPSMPPMRRLLAIMAQLRNPDGGCPWDLEQDFETIAPHTIEEAYEVADAIHHGDMAHLKDELGDLLFQVVFYAQMAAENGDFTFDDVAEAICGKMIARHPHVFGSADIETAEAQTVAWEEQKAAERRAKADAENRAVSALDGVSVALPALTRALKIGKRAARVGFDWSDADAVTDKVHEELDELRRARADGEPDARIAEEMGDLLFTLVNLARHLDVDPESALRKANIKVEDRFRAMEADLSAQGKTVDAVSADEREAAWERAKTRLKSELDKGLLKLKFPDRSSRTLHAPKNRRFLAARVRSGLSRGFGCGVPDPEVPDSSICHPNQRFGQFGFRDERRN